MTNPPDKKIFRTVSLLWEVSGYYVRLISHSGDVKSIEFHSSIHSLWPMQNQNSGSFLYYGPYSTKPTEY